MFFSNVKMIRFFNAMFLLIATAFTAYGQRAFVNTDSTVISGVRVLPGKPTENAQFIRVKTGEAITRYTPSDAIRYGLKNGRQFQALTLESGSGNRYFFEHLATGKYDVYFLPKNFTGREFYISSDSIPLTALPTRRKAFRKAVSRYVQDCPQAFQNARHVRMNGNSLGRLFDDYQTCRNRYLSRPHIGLTFGIVQPKLRTKVSWEPILRAKYERQQNYFVGLFADMPIHRSNFSVALQPTLYKSEGSDVFDFLGVTYLLTYDELRLALPVMVRYTLLGKEASPFVEFGPAILRNINGSEKLYSYQNEGSDIYVGVDDPPLIAPNQIGLAAGMGFLIRQNSACTIMFQCRANKFYVTNEQLGSLKSNEIMFALGVLF
jgi:hypothetical protein